MHSIPVRPFLSSVFALRRIGSSCEVLLLKRAQSLAGAWCQVAGSIEEGETAWQAGLRELREETGLVPTSFYSADICEQFYEAERDAITMAPVFVAFVDPKAAVVLNHEHSAFRWFGLEEAVETVSFGGQRKALRWIEEEFVQRKPSAFLKIEFR
ncbi:MAG: NUDIX domain-containing protein [Pseudomonadota bacterium]